MSIDWREVSIRAVKQRVQEIFARPGGQDNPLNQFSAAEVLSGSLLQWKDRELITTYYLNAAVANITSTAKDAFFRWVAVKGQDDPLFRDVFYLKAALKGIGINQPRDQIKHLVSFNDDGTFQFKAGVYAEQRYKLIQGLRAHDASTDDIYFTHLQGLKADLEHGSLHVDPAKNKILDKINREILLYNPNLNVQNRQEVLTFYSANKSNNVAHQKLDALKKTVLGERIVIDYWKELFKLNLAASLLLTIPAAIIFPFYLMAAACTELNPSKLSMKNPDEVNASIKTELNSIRTERSQKKREQKISHRYTLLPPPPAENQVPDRAGEGFAYRMTAG